MTIRKKLFLIAALLLFIILIMTGVAYNQGSSLVGNLVNTTGMEILHSSVKNIDESIEGLFAVVDTAAAAIRHTLLHEGELNVVDLKGTMKALTQKANQRGVLELYVAIEQSGQFVGGTDWEPPADYDPRKRDWYQTAAAGDGKISLTDPYEDAETKTSVVTASIPIRDDAGKLLGVLGGDINLSGLQKTVMDLKIFGMGAGVLLLPKGLIIASTRPEDVLKVNLASDPKFPSALQDVAKVMVAGETGFRQYEYKGERRQMFFAPTKHGFRLGILLPVSVISSRIHRMTFGLLITGGVALLFSSFLLFTLIRGLTRNIRSMESATQKLGDGDLTAHYDDSGKDELGSIAGTLNLTVAALNASMNSIRNEADETAEQSQNLARLSEQTLSSMQEISSSMEEILKLMESNMQALQTTNNSIEEIASGANAAAQAAGDGAEGASTVSVMSENSAHALDQALVDIKNADAESTHSIERLKSLGKSVDAISGFVSTISSIADQTNLLALNAAIEAARAGEAGRGFAVVAEEVRKLAEESAHAAQRVETLITELQRNMTDSITATEKTGELLEETTKKTGSTQEMLREALSSLARLTDSIQSVAAVAEEQAAASSEMTGTVQRVTTATERIVASGRDISAASQETTKAAEAIAAEAQKAAQSSARLQEVVGRFVLDAPQSALAKKGP